MPRNSERGHHFARIQNPGGALQFAFGYNAQGDVTSKGAVSYSFDAAHRLLAATGVASYVYDGHGRRIKETPAGGAAQYQVYDLAGKRLLTDNGGSGVRLVYLGNTLVGLDRPADPKKWNDEEWKDWRNEEATRIVDALTGAPSVVDDIKSGNVGQIAGGILISKIPGGRATGAAAEKVAKQLGKIIEKLAGKDARRAFHDLKEGGMPDRSLSELKRDAREVLQEFGVDRSKVPDWLFKD